MPRPSVIEDFGLPLNLMLACSVTFADSAEDALRKVFVAKAGHRAQSRARGSLTERSPQFLTGHPDNRLHPEGAAGAEWTGSQFRCATRNPSMSNHQDKKQAQQPQKQQDQSQPEKQKQQGQPSHQSEQHQSAPKQHGKS
jgi:hypothetical protein